MHVRRPSPKGEVSAGATCVLLVAPMFDPEKRLWFEQACKCLGAMEQGRQAQCSPEVEGKINTAYAQLSSPPPPDWPQMHPTSYSGSLTDCTVDTTKRK